MTDSTAIIDGPAAIIDGRAALVLSRVLDRCLYNHVSLRRALADLKVSPEYQEAALGAEISLRDAGERWLIAEEAQRKSGENSETDGSGDGVSCEAMSVRAASQLLGCTPSRVRQLVRGRVLSGTKGPRGWQLDRREVLVYRSQRLGADVTFPPLAALPDENAA
jgi:hypothetical protein